MTLQRSAWLARPWFFVAVAVLALNDHVFKAAFPGWITGKLSDLAGLAMVGTLASVLCGARWGTISAGLAFVALKTVPGVAEVVAPFMGGAPTLRDPTDLLALLVLPPLWLVLARSRTDQLARNRRGWVAIGLAAAVLATAADSTPIPQQVTEVWFADGAFYATVGYGSGDGFPFRSIDGGSTWERLKEAPLDGLPPALDEVTDERCATDGTCYRSQGSTIERRVAGSDWTVDYGFTADVWSIAPVVNPSNGAQVVAAFDECVVHRTAGGAWESGNLVDATSTSGGETIVVANTPKWQLILLRALGTSATPVILLMLLSVMIWTLVPWPGTRITLQVVNVPIAAFFALFGGTRAVESYLWMNGIWAGITAAIVGLIHLSWRLEQRPQPQPAHAQESPPKDLR